jgi:hypothetical protein
MNTHLEDFQPDAEEYNEEDAYQYGADEDNDAMGASDSAPLLANDSS